MRSNYKEHTIHLEGQTAHCSDQLDEGISIMETAAREYSKEGVIDLLHSLASDALETCGLIQRTIVHIPVLATKDAGKLERTLQLFNQQKDCHPFTVCLNINYPESEADSPELAHGLDTCLEAIERFPGLDVRAMGTSFKKPTIGAIRKALWDYSMAQIYQQGATFVTGEQPIIGINNDVDIEDMSPRYIAEIQQYYSRMNRRSMLMFQPQATQVHHGLRPETHPNTSRAMLWYDFSIHQERTHGYEAGLVMPMGWYAIRGGFNMDDVTYETGRLTDQAVRLRLLSRAWQKTSPRRYLERFPTQGYGGIWSNETFGPEDTCRLEGAEQAARDATGEELRLHVTDHLEYTLAMYARAPFWIAASCGEFRKSNWDQMCQQVEERCQLARWALKRIIGLGIDGVEAVVERVKSGQLQQAWDELNEPPVSDE